jgi:hypothetical protein
LTEPPSFAAVDLGAESGRVIIGEVSDAGVTLRETHRFANRPVRLPDGLRWDLLGLFQHALDGLAAIDRGPRLHGIGVDAWGVDYGLLDDRNRLLGLPFHYRDTRTDGQATRALQLIAREELFAATGIQVMPINTAFQLLADKDTRMMGAAQSLALIPDLLASWLCGELANEATIASTTGLLRAGTARWATPVIEALGLPRRLFGDVAEPGTRLGNLIGAHADRTGLCSPVPLYAVASHDTASAFRRRLLDSLSRLYAELPEEQELLIEYKFFEPAFYATDLPDWGSALLVCQHLGDRARVLVDLGHHAQGVNVEQIVAVLADEARLGGFHFNNRKYADDDLIVGSVNPFELFLVFCELAGLDGPLPRLTIDQSHNVEAKLEAMLLSIVNLQEAYARALLVDRAALADAQRRGDVLAGHEVLLDAYRTDVRPLCARARLEMGGSADPVGELRSAGYVERIAAERQTMSTTSTSKEGRA